MSTNNKNNNNDSSDDILKNFNRHKPNKDMSIGRFLHAIKKMSTNTPTLDLDNCFLSYHTGKVCAIIDFKQYEFVSDNSICNANTVALWSLNADLPTMVVAYDARDYKYDFYVEKANLLAQQKIQEYTAVRKDIDPLAEINHVSPLCGRVRSGRGIAWMWSANKPAMEDTYEFEEQNERYCVKMGRLEFLRFGAWLRGTTLKPDVIAAYATPQTTEATIAAHRAATKGTSWDLTGDE
jgi:hypothetical protein